MAKAMKWNVAVVVYVVDAANRGFVKKLDPIASSLVSTTTLMFGTLRFHVRRD
jgi:hypothetical protein